jgi:hypothetical protein
MLRKELIKVYVIHNSSKGILNMKTGSELIIQVFGYVRPCLLAIG